jgi:hypothetical protein
MYVSADKTYLEPDKNTHPTYKDSADLHDSRMVRTISGSKPPGIRKAETFSLLPPNLPHNMTVEIVRIIRNVGSCALDRPNDIMR